MGIGIPIEQGGNTDAGHERIHHIKNDCFLRWNPGNACTWSQRYIYPTLWIQKWIYRCIDCRGCIEFHPRSICDSPTIRNFGSIRFDFIELNWIEFDFIELNSISLNWIGLIRPFCSEFTKHHTHQLNINSGSGWFLAIFDIHDCCFLRLVTNYTTFLILSWV